MVQLLSYPDNIIITPTTASPIPLVTTQSSQEDEEDCTTPREVVGTITTTNHLFRKHHQIGHCCYRSSSLPSSSPNCYYAPSSSPNHSWSTLLFLAVVASVLASIVTDDYEVRVGGIMIQHGEAAAATTLQSEVQYGCGLRLRVWVTSSAHTASNVKEGVVLAPTTQLPGVRDGSKIEVDVTAIRSGDLQMCMMIQRESEPFEPIVASSSPLFVNVTPRVAPNATAASSTTFIPFTYPQPISFVNPELQLPGVGPVSLFRFAVGERRGVDYSGSLSSARTDEGRILCRFVPGESVNFSSYFYRVNETVPSLVLSSASTMPIGVIIVCDFERSPDFAPIADEFITVSLPVTSTNTSGAFQTGHQCFGFTQPFLKVHIDGTSSFALTSSTGALAAIAVFTNIASSLVSPEHIIELQMATFLLMNECASASDQSAVEWAAYFVVSPFATMGSLQAALLNLVVLCVGVMLVHFAITGIVWYVATLYDDENSSRRTEFKSICSTMRFPSVSLVFWKIGFGGTSFYGSVGMADNTLSTPERVGAGIIAVGALIGYMIFAVVIRKWGDDSHTEVRFKPHLWPADKIKAKNRTFMESLTLNVLPRGFYAPRSHYFRWMSALGMSRYETINCAYIVLTFCVPHQIGILSVVADRSISCVTVFIITTVEALVVAVAFVAIQPARTTLFNVLPAFMGILVFLISLLQAIGGLTVSSALDVLKPALHITISIITIIRSLLGFVLYVAEERRFKKAAKDKKMKKKTEEEAKVAAAAAASIGGGRSGDGGITSSGTGGGGRRTAAGSPSSRPLEGNVPSAETQNAVTAMRALAQFNQSASEQTEASIVGDHLNESSAYSQLDSYMSGATSTYIGTSLSSTTGSHRPGRRRTRRVGGANASVVGGRGSSIRQSNNNTSGRRTRRGGTPSDNITSEGSFSSASSYRSSSPRGGGGARRGRGGADQIIDPNLVQTEGGGYGYAYQSQWVGVDGEDAFEEEEEDEEEEDSSEEEEEDLPVPPAIIGTL